jgi:hypothetical protein
MSAPSTRCHGDGFTLGLRAGPGIARTRDSLAPQQVIAGQLVM